VVSWRVRRERATLKWSDVDERAGVIRVVRNIYRGKIQDSTKNGDNEDAPRMVPLLPEVVDALRARRKEMLGAQHPGLDEGWIFPLDSGKVRRASTGVRDALRRACKACSTTWRISPHGLRHTSNDHSCAA
jgi:integrase